jgi:hypothetical protein
MCVAGEMAYLSANKIAYSQGHLQNCLFGHLDIGGSSFFKQDQCYQRRHQSFDHCVPIRDGHRVAHTGICRILIVALPKIQCHKGTQLSHPLLQALVSSTEFARFLFSQEF